MVCVHGFMDTWRTWELVLPMLEGHHDVLALTLPGHAGGPPLTGAATGAAITDELERAMDDAGFGVAHLVGNSLGGYLALQLAARGRAESVVALAPAGGWATGDASFRALLDYQRMMQEDLRTSALNADAIVATRQGRRRATQLTTENFAHIPAGLLAHQIRGVMNCEATVPLIEGALRECWLLDAERITCPVRVVWGTADRLLPWPAAAARFRTDWLPHADWIEIEGVGHAPQLDVPLVTAHLITDFATR